MNMDVGLGQNSLQLGHLQARWRAKDADKEKLER